VPQADPLHPVPERLQVTAVFVELATVAVNCCFAPTSSSTAVGDMVIPSGGTIVTVAVADLEVSATEVAVTEILAGFGTAEGAV